ncbi:MICAL-like protein 1 isoform X2 [Xiphias gladius]|uniref:MICAL-like protein 1 isoform X2 n=1 Tax=Xiphias gladius TaxID=8245 RepID=UPI001A9A0CB9|nr:MICAL-like protein 1 isoform X2 [Xiphias gladius]
MSNLTQEMASPKALREWCRVTCANYPNVEIKNMSTSFRDGLAFCAIIHKHRPDLIDFSSLSKDNIYLNNKLAFEVAETKLGIPALLDPKEIVFCKVPDCLSVITYLSQYYYYFNRKSYGPASFRSSYITVLNNLTKSKTPVGLKPLKSSTDLETGQDHLTNTRPRAVCNLCFKPVHLIQRHLIDGKFYHRSCFRCKVCNSTLLAESYTQGSDAGSLICTHHITDNKSIHVDLNQKFGSTENRLKCKFQAGYFSLGGLAITSVPHYTMKTESLDRPVCKTPEAEGKGRQEKSREVKSRENRDSTVGLKSMVKKPAPPYPPLPSVKDSMVEGAGKAGPASILADGKIQQEATKTQQPSELSSLCVQVTEGISWPVPAPRRMLYTSVVPVPAPRTKTSRTTSSSPAAGYSSSQSKNPLNSSHITSPTTGSPKVKTNHPWMAIVHPGPWTQLPPAPAPVPTPRSKSVSNLRGSWYRPKVPPPNPFGEDVDEDTQEEAEKPGSTDQTKSSVEASHSDNDGNLTNKLGDLEVAVCSGDAENTAIKSYDNNVKPPDKPILPKRPDFKEAGGAVLPDPPEEVSAGTNTAETSSEKAGNTSQIRSPVLDENGGTAGSLPDVTEAEAGPHVASDEAQSHFLPRSLSVPVITSIHSQSSLVPVGIKGENEYVTSCPNKPARKENPCDRKPAMPKSKTFQALPSRRAPAPGHGFPLIKRKVQTDQHVSTEDLQTEMGELDKHLETLERRGVELERNLRDCKNSKEEERMLMEWFSLIHDRHVLVRKDTELVYLTKQQKLDERQADVEYELRCLLNKPESDWSQEDRGREQQLMDELVTIIEQRNQIISSLDQDRQRVREEDRLWEVLMKNKEFQKEGLKELKKSKGKFKPKKVFKMLNHKAESTKDSMDKKS